LRICLGFQLVVIALGAQVVKMKFDNDGAINSVQVLKIAMG